MTSRLPGLLRHTLSTPLIGGVGVLYEDIGAPTCRDLGRHNERWRFKADDELACRPRDAARRAFAAAAGGGEEDLVGAPAGPETCDSWPQPPFPEVPASAWGSRGWRRVASKPWMRSEPQVVLEARGLGWVVAHL